MSRLLCFLGLHTFRVWHNGMGFVSQCRQCKRYEAGYEVPSG